MAAKQAKLGRLTSQQKALIRGLSFGLSDFEPFGAFFAPRRGLLDALIEAGLVETGPSNRPAVSSIGYRLSKEGWALHQRLDQISHHCL